MSENTPQAAEQPAAVMDPGSAAKDRNRVIIRTSVIGILTNVFLAAFKAAVGLLSHSIAVLLDAVNNLSDALSSVITIIGTRLAGRAPDRKHPLGHGRIEYISAMIVAAIVLYAGVTSLVESVKKIITPEAADYSTISLIIISVAIPVKLILGHYVKSMGKKVNSDALIASGSDAWFDAILSASVLTSAIIFLITGVSLEAWVGALISAFIIRAGIEMMKDTISEILGRRADPEVTSAVRRLLTDEPEILGAYDLILHNYGPNRNYASVHVELADTMTVEEVDRLTRRVEERVYRETGVILTGVGVYSRNTKDDEAARIRNRVQQMVLEHDWALQLHGFHADPAEKTMRFDVVISFDISPKEGLEILYREIGEAFPDYTVRIVPDADIAD